MMQKKYIYLCGPTVYNKVHIGNMRPIVTFDLIVRGWKYLEPKNVIFIHNITDIDDKIIAQAQQEQLSETQISQTYFAFYQKMLKAFNIQTIDVMPKVTDHMELIVDFVANLQTKNYAYEANHSIYFATKKLKSYGEVSHIKLEQALAQKELEQANSFDFALWKSKTEGQTWNLKLGQGRPGWHTECAAFVAQYANQNTLLIHGGGIDLKFPHHENENAQYQALYNKPITQNWLHIGVINWKNQKMSKSIGNLIYADQFLNQYALQVNSSDLFRLLILSTAYYSTIELTDQLISTLIKKQIQLEKIVNWVLINDLNCFQEAKANKEIALLLSKAAFSDVFKILNEQVKNYNKNKDDASAQDVFQLLNFLGFTICKTKIKPELKIIFQQWKEYLQAKNFVEADRLRQILIEHKII